MKPEERDLSQVLPIVAAARRAHRNVEAFKAQCHAARKLKSIPRKSKKQAAKDRQWSKVTKARIKEVGGVCERCRYAYWPGSLYGHHKLPRSQGGLSVFGNLAVLCYQCHRSAHDYPALAYASGWLLHPWDANKEIGGTA